MIRYRQGEVVLLPFPFTDLSGHKQRPAIVISADWYNELRDDRILVAITSHVPLSPASDELLLSEDDLKSAGLPKASIVKLGKVVALHHSLIRKQLGEITASTFADVLDGVRSVITPK